MKAICINANPGFNSGDLPPFSELEICLVKQSPYHPDDYLVNENFGMGWSKKRFMLVSTIDEKELAEQRLQVC